MEVVHAEANPGATAPSEGADESPMPAGQAPEQEETLSSGVAASRHAKERRPLDPEKRDRAAARALVRREVQRLKGAKDLGELEKLFEERRGGKGKPKSDSPADPPTQAPAPVSVAPVAAPAPLPAAPSDTPQGPGWPRPSEIAAAAPMAAALWSQAAQLLRGTRYEIAQPQLGVLVEGTAPLVAKYAIPKSPEAAAGIALALVFGPPAIAHLFELGARYIERRKGALKAA